MWVLTPDGVLTNHRSEFAKIESGDIKDLYSTTTKLSCRRRKFRLIILMVNYFANGLIVSYSTCKDYVRACDVVSINYDIRWFHFQENQTSEQTKTTMSKRSQRILSSKKRKTV